KGALTAAGEALSYAHDIDDLAAIANAIASAVEVAYAARSPEIAAVLAGMLDSNAFRPGLFPHDPHLLTRQRILEAARATLGDDAYESAFARGVAMSYDAGLAYALGELDQIANNDG